MDFFLLCGSIEMNVSWVREGQRFLVIFRAISLCWSTANIRYTVKDNNIPESHHCFIWHYIGMTEQVKRLVWQQQTCI